MAYRDDLEGVGGWLAVFLFTLGIISPLVIVGGTAVALSDSALPTAYGALWPTLEAAEWAFAILVAVICVGTAVRFMTVFRASTVRIGIGALWSIALLMIVGEPLLISVIARIPFDALFSAAVDAQTFRPLIYAGIWTAYLLNSQRVQNTYVLAEEDEDLMESPAAP